MIKGNRILFGYGTILVGDGYNSLTLIEIRPPQEIGENCVNEVEEIQSIKITASYDSFSTLLKKLDNVKENKEIEFQNYIFDFNEYNEKSVDVIIKQIKKSIMYSQLSFAC